MDEASSKAAGRRPFALDPTGDLYNRWQVVSCAFTLFNWFSIICRVSFMDVQVQFLPVWLTLDYVSDAVNLVDMVFLSRTGFMECGLLVTDVDRMRQHYVRSSRFRLDALALVPTDLLYAYTGVHYPVVRLNRLLRFPRIFDCFDQVETHTNYPKTFRIIKLVVYIYLMVHWNACFYYLLSAYIGFGQDGWVYPAHETPGFGGTGRQYMFCIYFSTLILLTIGNIPKAEREAEFLFVVVDFLITIFVFATILGNVASICASVNEAGDKFLAEFNEVKDFVRFRAIGKDMDRKVVEWYEYLHLSNKSLGEEDVLKELPVTLRAAIAINVHMQTLQKVEIFKNCELGLLEELVLKLRPKLYSPGDYVCRKGDIGREMYFIKEGKLAVVADDGVTQYAVLGDGSYFGEISILKIPGSKAGNRRTANIRSIGYSDLFRLSKEDLQEVLREFPAAGNMLEEKGKQILAKMGLLDTEMEGARAEPQQLERTVETLDGAVRALQTKVARLLAEHKSGDKKIRTRLRRLERVFTTAAAAGDDHNDAEATGSGDA
ncbi:cyclic nucleotide-gated channel alpha-3-like isoform X4 [Lampetra planeri]